MTVALVAKIGQSRQADQKRFVFAGPMAMHMPMAVESVSPLQKPERVAGAYAVVVCVFASLGGLVFGYGQGVTSGVLVMDSFLNDFCVGWGGSRRWTHETCSAAAVRLPTQWLSFLLWFNMSYNAGCILGALVGGIIADRYGRRPSIFLAGLWFCLGTTWLCLVPAQAHSWLLLARALQGMGVGSSSFSLPVYYAEMAPKQLRSFVSGFMQMPVVAGVLLANLANEIFKTQANGWRVANAMAMSAPLIVMLGIFFVPESPRWTYASQGQDAAEVVLKRLRQSDNVKRELEAIGDQMEAEGRIAGWSELLRPSILKRLLVAMLLHVLQQASGINAVFTYGGLIFKDVTGDGGLAMLLLATINFLSTIPSMQWVDSYGRRQLLLLGAVGMMTGHLISATAFTAGCPGHENHAGCSAAASYATFAGCAFFIMNFAVTWGVVCWLYPTEIFPPNVRAKAVSLATMANWVSGTFMALSVELFPWLDVNGVFFVFAVACLGSGLLVYAVCPETQGMGMEDIEVLFASHPPPRRNAAKQHPTAKHYHLVANSIVA